MATLTMMSPYIMAYTALRMKGRATPFIKLFTLFDKYDICAVFYVGGNDSMDTIAKRSCYG